MFIRYYLWRPVSNLQNKIKKSSFFRDKKYKNVRFFKIIFFKKVRFFEIKINSFAAKLKFNSVFPVPTYFWDLSGM